VRGKQVRHFLLATHTVEGSVCTDWETPQSNLQLTFAKPKFEIGISRPQEYAVRDMVTRWHGGACTVRKVMHVGRWGRSLCCARKDENHAFDMGLQSSCHIHVVWEMRKIRRGTLTERGFHFFMKQPNQWRFRIINRSEFSHRQCLFEVWFRLEASTKPIQ